MKKAAILVAASTAIATAMVGGMTIAWAQSGPPPGAMPPGPPPSMPSSGLTLDDVTVRQGPESVGRGAAYPPVPDWIVGPDLKGISGGMGSATFDDPRAVYATKDGEVPEGIVPLERDIFTSDDFYADRELWSDPRYFRCMSPWGIENVWGGYEAPTSGKNPPETIAWGYCDRDYDRANIVSPYPFKTAQEHYDALKAEAVARGGPTKYTHDNPPPDWNGYYGGIASAGFGQYMSTMSWIHAQINQVPTYLSLLTPEYQTRMMQQMYHDAHNQLLWPGAFCWPDGFLRRWFGSGGLMLVTPDLVEIANGANERLVRDIWIDREFKTDGTVPYLSTDSRQWMGETVGFWDGEVLVTMSSNIKGWAAHGWFENSSKLQTVETYTPIEGPDGKFVGVLHEATLYDPEAFVAPLRVVERLERVQTVAETPARLWPQCTPTLFPINGIQTLANPGDTIQYTVPNFNGRPWADIWSKLEDGMQRPVEENVLEDVLKDY
jgi:hypothetical protein